MALTAADARAALHTQLSFNDDSYAAEYSQGIPVSITLSLADGATPVDPAACGSPCRVSFSIARADDPDSEALLVPEPDPTIDALGQSDKRVVFVDGAHGDFAFVASDAGVAYTLTARFLGFGNPTVDECLPETPDADDGDLCPAEATVTLTLTSEVPAIILTDGREGALGDVVQLSATVSDPNGDARLDSTDLEGAAEKLLEDVTVRFFYDADGDGRPDGNELIDEAQTNALGVAALDFTLDPQFVRAGDYTTGIHAEFSGDDRYGVTRASTRLIVRPAAVNPAATLLEIEPKEVPADGNSTITLRARLVDQFNNLLDETSDPYDVEFKVELGSLEKDVVRDPNNGSYRQTLRATREGGTGTVTVFVDGVEGASAEVTFVREGCQCGHADLVAFGPVLAVLAMIRRRKP
jgi:Invasin, domain 3